ncbi:hypothetical protein ES703_30322 [subsurface metagenome]
MNPSVRHKHKVGPALRNTRADKAKDLFINLFERDVLLKLDESLNGITAKLFIGFPGLS